MNEIFSFRYTIALDLRMGSSVIDLSLRKASFIVIIIIIIMKFFLALPDQRGGVVVNEGC